MSCPGGVLPMMACLYGKAPAERGTFFSLRIYERVGILLVEAYERVGKSAIWSVKGLKGLTDELCGFKKSRKPFFVIDSYLNDSAFTAVKRDAKF